MKGKSARLMAARDSLPLLSHVSICMYVRRQISTSSRKTENDDTFIVHYACAVK